MRYLPLFAMIFCIATGCLDEKLKQDFTEINVEENVANFKDVKICEFNCEIRYVALETDSIFLKAAVLSAFKEDYILISDRTLCLLYGRNGNFLARIGNKGKGPSEYNFISKMQFGPNNNIYISDGSGYVVYDLSGRFLYKVNPKADPDIPDFKDLIGSFTLYSDTVFIGQLRNDSGHEKFKAMFFDQFGRAVKLVENHDIINKIKRNSNSANGDADFFRNGKTFYFKERLSDTIFTINDQYQFAPAYYFNLGKYGMPKEVRELRLSEFSKKRMDYIDVYQVFGTAEYLFFPCAFHNHHPIKDRKGLNLPGTMPNWAWAIMGVFDKRTNKLVFTQANTSGTLLTTSGFYNDYDGGISFLPRNQVNESTLSMWVEAYQLKEHVASDAFKNSTPKYPEKKKELQKLADSLSENDNPVLILCTFKK